jgi:Domain of unknown function (DUF4258)
MIGFPGNQPNRLSDQAFLAKVQFVAADKIRYTVHALQRGRARGITPSMVIGCLQMGTIVEGPYLNLHSNWQATVLRHKAGISVSVVAAIEWEKQVIVITTF